MRRRPFQLFSIVLAFGVIAVAGTSTDGLLSGLEWRFVGPTRGGRVLTASGVANDPNTYYFGAAAGGIWKTTDRGAHWVPIFEKQSVASIGALAIAPSNPNIIYAGTGEACIRGNISHGDGVYKSSDAGKTWTNIGLTDTRHIGRIAVDPNHPEVVYVAALGHVYGPNRERGVFRSQDGGKNWTNVLFVDDHTGAIDVSIDAHNPQVIYAAMWDAHRTPWSLVSGGQGSGLYRSMDGGSTWKHLTGNGLPPGVWGRVGVAVSPADPARIYALIESKDGGLFRSDDGGARWQRVDASYDIRGRPWYYTHVTADPVNADTVYVQDFGFHKSTDGGHTFTMLNAPHGDYHALWIDPANPKRMINGNDGGASISFDGGKNWSRQDNQPTAQFYHVVTDNFFPYYIYGAQQDSGTVAISSHEDWSGSRPEWYGVGGGESGMISPDPRDPDIVYAGSNYGTFTRFDRRTGQAQNVSPWPENYLNMPAAMAKYRFQWTPPLLISPNDPNTIYIAAQVLFKSTDSGMHWSVISPDLTRNEKGKQESSGGPVTQDNTGVEYYNTIFAVAESPLDRNLIWAGTDDGLIHITRSAGKQWTNVTPTGLADGSLVSIIEASPHDAGTAYLAIDRHKMDDIRPYIYKTSDFGKSWNRIDSTLPQNCYIHVVREDPKRKSLLFAGSETGVFVSFDDGANWQSLQQNLPTVPVHDLVVHGDDLIAATYGRAFWSLDDIEPLRQWKDDAGTKTTLFTPPNTYRVHGAGLFARGVSAAPVDYYLPSEPKSAVSLEIRDERGKVVRQFTSQPPKSAPASSRLPAKAGLNRFKWDLERTAAASTGTGWPSGAVLVVPGKYEARLTADGATYTAPLEIKLDPRIHTTREELQKQLDLALRINDLLARIHRSAQQCAELTKEIKSLTERLPAGHEDLSNAGSELNRKLVAVEDSLIGWKSDPTAYSLNFPPPLDDRLTMLSLAVESADAAPNQPAYDVFNDLEKQAQIALAHANEVLSKDVKDFNELVRKADIPAISTPSAH